MTEQVHHGRRLVIAAVSLGDAEAALALAQSILERSPAMASGLLIETGLAGLVTGPGHRVVAASGTLLSIPSPEQARRMRRGEERVLKQHLAALATAASTEWRLETAEGALVAAACATSGEGDILLLCQRPIFRFRGHVLVIGRAGVNAVALRDVAEALARSSLTTVLDVPTGQGADLAALFAHIDRKHAAAVVVDCTAGLLNSVEDLERLVAAARCPVVVFGADRISRRQAIAASVEAASKG